MYSASSTVHQLERFMIHGIPSGEENAFGARVSSRVASRSIHCFMTELDSCGMRPKGPDRGCVRTSASTKPWSRTATARWITWFKTETSDRSRRKPPKPLTRVQIPAAAPSRHQCAYIESELPVQIWVPVPGDSTTKNASPVTVQIRTPAPRNPHTQNT